MYNKNFTITTGVNTATHRPDQHAAQETTSTLLYPVTLLPLL